MKREGGRQGGTKRLFVAADIDDATKAQIEIISRSLRDAIGTRTRASWVRADRMHLTLQFFAGADAALEERIMAALGGALDARAFDLSFDGLGFFPERGSPRVLWLGIRNGEAELRRVQQIVRERLALPPEPFSPHLTLSTPRQCTYGVISTAMKYLSRKCHRLLPYHPTNPNAFVVRGGRQ